MPDAIGNFKGIAVPKVPWKASEHETAIAAQGTLFDGDGARTQYYFYCTCGMCGNLHRQRKTAVEEADLHLEG